MSSKARLPVLGAQANASAHVLIAVGPELPRSGPLLAVLGPEAAALAFVQALLDACGPGWTRSSEARLEHGAATFFIEIGRGTPRIAGRGHGWPAEPDLWLSEANKDVAVALAVALQKSS